MKLSKWQKNVLELLLDKYERSKRYKEDVDTNRAIMIKPTEIYKDYDSDFADVDEQRDFETEMLELKAEQIIGIRSKGNIISRIELLTNKVSVGYVLLKREPLKDAVQKQIALYSEWLGKHHIIDGFCSAQIEFLVNGKKAKYETDIAEKLLKLMEFVLSNNEVILERELSVAVFGDTKVFENGYKARLVSVLKNYGDVEEVIAGLDEEKEITYAILEEFNIYSNLKYVYFKGNGEIDLQGGVSYILTPDLPMAMPMEKLKRVKKIIVNDSTVMTVENLASYNRIFPQDCFCIYLAGYHNTARQMLIKMIYSQNPDKSWKHFGDIDPDGFMILENLKRKTGIDIMPAYMDIQYLDKYAEYGKPLQINDITKAKNLIEKGLYAETVRFMLENNLKLEQEVISWMEKI